ncbi:hypothetical protein C2G38_2044227 [Gigaspora rosea]|uniref:Uncharacterized protein n=1 Tax=Gigaspora rosea TaxID=44941 RepID=A0A397UQ71_9GLOM|nr:hypothetical protein C2G38_2044227 [Gigaspora rosea]
MSISHTNVKFIPQKNINLEVKFIPSDNLDSFSRFLFTDEKLDWHMEGQISVKYMDLTPTEVELSKHIEFDGMKILAVNSIDVPSEYSEVGISVKMDIKNTSQIKVELDNMPFDLKYMNQIIGKISSTNFSNDNNTLSFSGYLLPGDTIEKLDVMSKAFSKIISGEELHLIFDARASLVSWLNKISLTVVITKETKINFNYKIIECAWDFTFDPKDQYSPRITLQTVIKYSNLFPLGIYKASCKIGLIYKESQFAILNIPYITITDSLGIIESSITAKLNIFSEDSKDLFSEILRKIFMTEEVIFTVKGELNVIAKTPVGEIEMKQIQFNFDKNIKCQIQPGIIINSMEIINATKDAIEIRALATITNPSNIGIYLGSNVEFDLISDQNIKIASMIIENFKLKRENDDIIVKLKYLTDKDSGFKVIENYLNRRSSLLSIKATNNTTSIYPLRGAFEAIELEALLPGINAQFINEIEVSLRTKDSFMLHNPLKTKLHIFGFTSKVVNMENKQIAVGITEQKNDGIVVEPGQTKSIRIETSHVDVGNAIRNIKDCVSANGVRENVECVLMFGIGEDIKNLFRIDLNYTQQNIKVIWDLGLFKF